jgi:hypothetical protein
VSEPTHDAGRTAAFATFSPFKSFLKRIEAIFVHIGAHGEDEHIKPLRFLHHAFWVRIAPRTMKKAAFADEEIPKHGALLFCSAFNGDASTYIRGFSDELSEEMDALWSGSEEWKGAGDFLPLFDFINDHARPIQFFFNNYRNTSKEIRAAVQLRAGLDALFDKAYEGNAEAFKREYLRVAQTMWGNAEETSP